MPGEGALGHRCSCAFETTQAGAGAILGQRLDDTPMDVVVSGLSSPEALVVWKPLSSAGAGAGGLRLYWSDVGANRIDTCFLEGTGDTLLKCGEVRAVRSDVPAVTGLGLDPGSQTLYWADSNQMRLQSAPLTDPTADTTVFEPLRLPTAIAVQPMEGKISGAVFFIDQATPATLSKVWINGSGTRELMGGGLSQPRAAVYQLGACYLADPGTGSLLVVEEQGVCPCGKRTAEHILPIGRGWPRLAEAGGRPSLALALAARATSELAEASAHGCSTQARTRRCCTRPRRAHGWPFARGASPCATTSMAGLAPPTAPSIPPLRIVTLPNRGSSLRWLSAGWEVSGIVSLANSLVLIQKFWATVQAVNR